MREASTMAFQGLDTHRVHDCQLDTKRGIGRHQCVTICVACRSFSGDEDMLDCKDWLRRSWQPYGVTYSLKAMFVGMFVLSVFLSWVAFNRTRFTQEKRAVENLKTRYGADVNVWTLNDGYETSEEDAVDTGWKLREIKNGRLYIPITDVGLFDVTIDQEVVDYLNALPFLKRLDLQKCQFDGHILLRLSRFHYLEELHVSDCQVPLGHIVSQLDELTRLEILRLENAGISDEHLAELGQLGSVRDFYLAGNELITDRGLMYLGKLPSLRYLDLCAVSCSSRGMKYLAPLTNIRALLLSDTTIDDSGVKTISEQFPRITTLSLSNTPVSDAGMAYISNLDDLDTLNLRNTAVSDAGVRQLGRLRFLYFLDLTGTRITSSCINTLTRLPSLTNDSVMLGETEVTAEALNKLKNELSTRPLRLIHSRRMATYD